MHNKRGRISIIDEDVQKHLEEISINSCPINMDIALYVLYRCIAKHYEESYLLQIVRPSQSHLITEECIRYFFKKNKWVLRKTTGRKNNINYDEAKGIDS